MERQHLHGAKIGFGSSTGNGCLLPRPRTKEKPRLQEIPQIRVSRFVDVLSVELIAMLGGSGGLRRGGRNPAGGLQSPAPQQHRRFRILGVVGLGDFLLVLVLVLTLTLTLLPLAHGAVQAVATVPMPDAAAAPPGVAWVMQLSDIHISKWAPSRGRALRKAAGRALKVIQPGVVLVSGDLTDAKSKDMKTTQQEEVEWMEYHTSFREIANESGVPLQNFFDLRGNHDKYGVPLQSPLDYYSKYSITAAMNRTGSPVQSVTVQGRDGSKNFFVGFDDSMQVGLRGPSNLFGHSTDEILDQLDEELKRWDDANEATVAPVTKIVYGHFPMSFTASSETGKRVEDVMASNGVSAYVCGHLHTSFGRRLYKHHKEHKGDFWEWEMGDWRISRMMRVMAIDHGHTSFVDVELIPPSDSAEGEFSMPTIILQTYPLDSTFMLQSSPKGEATNSIRALVFSETAPAWVEARIYDSRSNSLANVTLLKSPTDEGAGHYFTAYWDWERHVHKNCAMEIVAQSKDGRTSHSQMRSVSATGHPEPFRPTVLVSLILYVKWERLVPVALWSPVILLTSLLVAALLSLWWKNDKCEQWAERVFVASPTWSGVPVKVLQWPFLGLVELCSRDFLLWALLLAYVVYLATFPWFWARCLADDYPMGRMSLHGWTVKPSNVASAPTVSGLGVPDIVVIATTYLGGVVIPIVLAISLLAAERASYEFSPLGKCSKCSKANPTSESDRLLAPENEQGPLPRSHFTGKPRKGLFLLCSAIVLTLGQCCLMIGRAYGFSALATAPVYAWGFPPLLLLLSFHRTSRTSCRCSLKHEAQKRELPKTR